MTHDVAPAASDPVMTAIGQAQQLALDGDCERARQSFAALWERVGPDGDPLHRVTLAHSMADLQDDPAEELEWDRRALEAADCLTDERVREYEDALALRTLYPSLYLNLASDCEKLGRLDEAQQYLALVVERLDDLPEGEYSDLVRSGVAALRDLLPPVGPVG